MCLLIFTTFVLRVSVPAGAFFNENAFFGIYNLCFACERARRGLFWLKNVIFAVYNFCFAFERARRGFFFPKNYVFAFRM